MTADLLALARELEAADDGHMELDEQIHAVIGSPGADDPQLYSFIHGDYPPHYTTSVDAKLPWEDECGWDIQGLVDPGPHRWRATAFPDKSKIVTTSYGATEPLARRSAALKAEAARRGG